MPDAQQAAPAAPATATDLPCVYRGGSLRSVRCALCGDRVRYLEVYECKKHGECTANAYAAGQPEHKCLGCDDRKEPEVPAGNKLILRMGLSPGDVLTLTAAVYSLHKQFPGQYAVDVRTPAMELWQNNPGITKIPDEEGQILDLHYPAVHRSNQVLGHFLAGYTENLGVRLGIPLTLQTNRPHVYLSADEKAWVNQVRTTFAGGKDIPYWLLTAGTKPDFTAKQWPLEHYQEVVDRTRGHVQWVQVGAKEHDHPALRGVMDLRGKTDHRQFVRLVYHSHGGLGPSTYLQHLCAALEKPYICLLGGREPVPWVAGYPFQHTLHTVGALPCCRDKACWKSRTVALKDSAPQDRSLCENPVLGGAVPAPKCMAMIRPEEVIALVERLT